jgi:hypothetical protein
MAIQLFKLAGRPIPKITTSQANRDYFYTVTAVGSATHYLHSVTISILAAKWVKGNGDTVSAFATGEGKECLEINGVMQQSGLYLVKSTAIDLLPPVDGLTLEKGYPITLQSFNARTVVSTTRTFAIP